MEGESLVEEAHVNNVRLFKCPNFKEEEDGLILFRIFDTEYCGQPGTQFEAVQVWEPKHIGFRFGPQFIPCLYGDLHMNEDDDDDDDEVFKTVTNTYCFGFDVTRVLTQEIIGYMRSCYRLYEDTFLGLSRDSELKNDFLLVIVVDVCGRMATVDYLEAKVALLNGKDRISTHDDQDGIRTLCDDYADIDDEGSTRARDDDVNKASRESSGMYYDKDDDDDDMDCGEDDDMHKAVTSEESKDMHVDDNYQNYDDDDGDMQEDEGGLDYYCFDKNSEDSLYDIIECVKQWKQVENEDEEPIVMLEAKPLLTIEEMELEWMEDGNYKPLIGTTTKTNSVDVENCSICISGYTENVPKSSTFPWCPKMNSSRIVTLGCGHVFHYHCVFKWLSKTPSCPLCRSSTLVHV